MFYKIIKILFYKLYHHNNYDIVAPIVVEEVNYMITVEEIRDKIKYSGWKLHEIPIRKGQEIINWKLIAENNSRSFTIEGETLLKAITNLGKVLGLQK